MMNKGKLVSVDFDEPEQGQMILRIATEGGGICAGDMRGFRVLKGGSRREPRDTNNTC